MVHIFLSRRLRAFVLMLLALFFFICMFEVLSNGTTRIAYVAVYLPTFGNEPFLLQNGEKGNIASPEPVVAISASRSTNAYTRTKKPARTSSVQSMTSSEVSMSTIVAEKEKESKSSRSSTSTNKPRVTSSYEKTSVSVTPTSITGAIVAAVNRNASLDWIPEIQNPMWTLHRYNHDDPSPPARVSFPIDKGNEAMPYLSYIINNYDNLPSYSVFIHGHRTAWHQQGDIVDIINNLRFNALNHEGYVSLRCDWFPSCPREIRPQDHDAAVWGPGVWRNETEEAIASNWAALFSENVTIPRTIASQCCAQFAISRAAILRHPQSTYIRMREWLVDTPLRSEVSGRVFEKLWAYIFTGKGVNCPPPSVCACKFFGQCGWVDWTMPPEGLEKWPEKFDGPPMPVVEVEIKTDEMTDGARIDSLRSTAITT